MKKDKNNKNEKRSCKKFQGGIRQWQKNEEEERKINGGKRSRKIRTKQRKWFVFLYCLGVFAVQETLFHKNGLLSCDFCITEPIYIKKTAFSFSMHREIFKKLKQTYLLTLHK
jgi:hypothetical protein